MQKGDYEGAFHLWQSTPGVRIDASDSREAVEKYLERNPTVSFVAEVNGEIIGTVLCGEDGRRGYLQHLTVDERFRKKGVGSKLLDAALLAFSQLRLYEVRIFVLNDNAGGLEFWKNRGWVYREDVSVFAYHL